MSVRTLEELRSRFQTRDHPDGADFVDLIDSLNALQPLSVTEGHLANNSVAVRSIIPGTALQHLRTNPSSSVEWYDDAAQEVLVTQVNHGLFVNDVVAVDSLGHYVRARSNSANTAQPVGIVTQTESNRFVLATAGVVTLSGNTMNKGLVYYVDPNNAGRMTATRPSSAGTFISPVIVATSATTGVLILQEALLNTAPPLNFAPIYFSTPKTISRPVDFSTNTWQTVDLAYLAGAETTFRYAMLSVWGNSSVVPPKFISATLMRSAESVGPIQGGGAVVHTCGCAIGAFASSASVFMFPTYNDTDTGSSKIDFNIYPASITNTVPYSLLELKLLGYVV